MNSIGKIIYIPILAVLLTVIFYTLDTGSSSYQINQLVQPLIFAVSVVLCVFFAGIRRRVVAISLFLLLLMLITYLFNEMSISGWLGSLGFGELFIAIFSYSPEIIKEGKIENF